MVRGKVPSVRVPADICTAIIFQLVRPLPDDVLKLPSGIRASFLQEDVASRCEDLIEWRDNIVAKHWTI